MGILPGRPVGGSISATYGRVILPNAANADPNVSFTQDNISTAAELSLQPSSGTLDWHFGYQFATAIFEQQTGAPFTNLTHTAFTRGRWRFRPRTALIYDAQLNFQYYTDLPKAEAEGLVQSTPIRTRIGLSGLITERFAVLALLGWGASFDCVPVPQMQQYDSLIANAEVKWFLAASPGIAKATDLGLTLSSIALGYTRDFQNSYLGNFDGTDRGYLKFNYFFAGRALISVEGASARSNTRGFTGSTRRARASSGRTTAPSCRARASPTFERTPPSSANIDFEHLRAELDVPLHAEFQRQANRGGACREPALLRNGLAALRGLRRPAPVPLRDSPGAGTARC